MAAPGDSAANASSANVKPTTSSKMTTVAMFPVSVIIAGFCVMSLAYLICFCCCIIQYFVRRVRNPSATPRAVSTLENAVPKQKNDKLKNHFSRQYLSSLKRLNKNRSSHQMITDSSCVGFCPICFEEYTGNPTENFVGLIKTCGHFFHFDCIWEWLENHQTCPLCRGLTELKESDITGLSLRHVDAYKECAHQSENGVKKAPGGSSSNVVVEAGTSVMKMPQVPLESEAGVEATEDTITVTVEEYFEEEASSGIVVVAVDIEAANENQDKHMLMDSEENGDVCEVVIVTPSSNRSDHTNNINTHVPRKHVLSHDNNAFVVDDDT